MTPIRFGDVPLAGVRGVLIDVDDTVYAYEPAHRAGLAASHAALRVIGLELPFDDFQRLYRRMRDAVTERLAPQGACRSRLFAFQSMLEQRGVPSAYVPALRLEAAYWDAFIEAMTLDAGAEELLDRCAAAGILVCAVSDMQAHLQVRKLVKLGIASRVRFLVTSEEVGEEKPSARMFQAALAKLGLTAPEVIMLGDSAEKDVAGAQALRIRAYRVEATP